jgi:hypothetical protein
VAVRIMNGGGDLQINADSKPHVGPSFLHIPLAQLEVPTATSKIFTKIKLTIFIM